MLAEVMLYVPSIANFRLKWLGERLEAAQIASLVLEATPDRMVSKELKGELLTNAGAKAIALRRGQTRHLMLSVKADPMPDIDAHFDLRIRGNLMSITDAFDTMLQTQPRTLRVLDEPKHGAGDLIDIVIDEAPLKEAMIEYSINILKLSLVISVITAALLYFTLTLLFVRPMRRFTENMMHFREHPEDRSKIIDPSGRDDEIGMAEEELSRMQKQLSKTLHQKSRLADLGLAVSKISHDLRNILSGAHLISDRLSSVDDPLVKRIAPKLLISMDRAVDLCEQTLKHGKAEEAPPQRTVFSLKTLVDEVFEAVSPQAHSGVSWHNFVENEHEIFADRDQMFRVLMNLSRNSAQAFKEQKKGKISLKATREDGKTLIELEDTGPGIPKSAQKNIFSAFKGSTKRGGFGLGLSISAELMRAHGGDIHLVDKKSGAAFRLELPDRTDNANGNGSDTP